MSAWPTGLAEVLGTCAGTFGVGPIMGRERLAEVRQTGFVWTRRPGVLCLATTKHYVDIALGNDAVTGIILPSSLKAVPGISRAIIVADKPDELYHYLHACQSFPGGASDEIEVDPSARIDPSAMLRGRVSIGPDSVVGPRVVIDGPAFIGARVHIEAGVIVGCDGLYAKEVAGRRCHVPHFGGVWIGDDAFLHAGAVIVRSAIHGECTSVGRGTHIGVLSNIGHDVTVGEDATISSNVVIAGRAVVGAAAWIGASATISNRVRIGDGSEVRLGAAVVQDVPDGGDVSGNFAMPHAKNMKRYLKGLRDDA